MLSLLRNIVFLSLILVSCINKGNVETQIDTEKTNIENEEAIEHIIEVQNDYVKKYTFADYDKDDWENTYQIINEIYYSIRPDSKVFSASVEFVENSIKEIFIYYDDHIKILLDRFGWLEKIESPDKKLTGYTYFINTGGTAKQNNIILSYQDNNYRAVYVFKELFQSLDYELDSIVNLEDNVYLLGVVMSSGGFMVHGGYYCVETAYENNQFKLVPKNIFNNDNKLTYFVFVGDVNEFDFDEHNKTINIRIREDYIQMRYENGIFVGDYTKYEMMMK
jgi:hypothetical protein